MSDGELFHYTGLEGLKGILESQNLHSTHYRFLNDASEIQLAYEPVEGSLIDAFSRFIANDEQRFGWMPPLQRLGFAKEQASQLFLSIVRHVEEYRPIFVTSLCRHKKAETRENGLLSQWRGYGDEGGYCIVFDEAQLLGLLEVQDVERDTLFRHARNVTYLESNDLGNVDEFQSIAVKVFQQKYNNLLDAGNLKFPLASISRYPEDANFVEGLALDRFLKIVPFFKHEAFQEEDEFRIVASAFRAGSEAIDQSNMVKFKTRGSMLVPYLELFARATKLPIRRILVGPGRHSDLRKYALGQFLNLLGHSGIALAESGISFRKL